MDFKANSAQQSSPEASTPSRPEITPTQWHAYWLRKYSALLIGKEYSNEKRRLYWAIIRQFLEENPGDPKTISTDKIRAFLQPEPEERRHPLELFYEHIARSTPHLEILREHLLKNS